MANIFLYCLPRAFRGSVSTCSKATYNLCQIKISLARKLYDNSKSIHRLNPYHRKIFQEGIQKGLNDEVVCMLRNEASSESLVAAERDPECTQHELIYIQAKIVN